MPIDYSQLSTDDLLALKQGSYDKLSDAGLKMIRDSGGGSQFGQAADAGLVGTPASPRPYQGTPDLPLEQPLLDPVDLLSGAIGGRLGVKAAGDLATGPLRALFRYRLGNNPGQGFEQVAETVARTAPQAMQPAEATAEGLSNVMRSGTGQKALSASREQGLNDLYQQLKTAENAAVTEVPGQADRFRQLITELADANRAGYNPVTADARTGALSLKPLREAAAIRSDLQSMLSPEQWKQFQALQNEYAQGSALGRLFKAPKSPSGADVLLDQGALQARAKGMQGQLDPELLASIFRGGSPLQRDMSATLPIGLARFGSIRLPGTIMAGPPSTLQQFLMRLLGGTVGAGTGYGTSQDYLQPGLSGALGP